MKPAARVGVALAVLAIAALRRRRTGRRAGAATVLSAQHAASPSKRPVAALVVGAVAVAVCLVLAIAAYPTSDLAAAVAIAAAVWFGGPLFWGSWTGNDRFVDDLLRARSQPLLALILRVIRSAVVGAASLVAGLYILPLATVAYYFAERASGRLPPGSEGQFWVALVTLALVALAWAAYPFAAGFCAATDRRATRSGHVRALRVLAGVVRWGGRNVTGAVIMVRRTLWAAVPLVGTSVFAAIMFVGTLALQPALAQSDALEGFALAGLDAEQVAIGTAVGGAAGILLFEWLRVLRRTADWAALVLVAAFTLAVGGMVLAVRELTTHDHLWVAGPDVLAGLGYGVSVAALLELGHAIAAGAAVLLRIRDGDSHAETAAINEVPFRLGQIVGAGEQDPPAKLDRAGDFEVQRRQLLNPSPDGQLEPVIGGRGMPLVRVACLAALPFVLVTGGVFGTPSGALLLPWGALLCMACVSLILYAELLGMLLRRERGS